MKFFLDTADIADIRDLAATGLVDGVTTNPSPIVGRLDDVGEDGMTLVSDIVQIYRNYPKYKTEVLVASIRGTMHVVTAAKLGAHVGTMPPGVMRQLFAHPLTDKGLAAFLADWKKTGQSILDDKQKLGTAAE